MGKIIHRFKIETPKRRYKDGLGTKARPHKQVKGKGSYTRKDKHKKRLK